MPSINQRTGVPEGQQSSNPTTTHERPDDPEIDEGGGPAPEAEPTATLRTFRTGRLLGYKKRGWQNDVFFGQNLVGLGHGGWLRVGDPVSATPRRPRGAFSRGLRGVDYAD